MRPIAARRALRELTVRTNVACRHPFSLRLLSTTVPRRTEERQWSTPLAKRLAQAIQVWTELFILSPQPEY